MEENKEKEIIDPKLDRAAGLFTSLVVGGFGALAVWMISAGAGFVIGLWAGVSDLWVWIIAIGSGVLGVVLHTSLIFRIIGRFSPSFCKAVRRHWDKVSERDPMSPINFYP